MGEQFKYYQDYWKQSNEHFRRLETDTAYQNMIQARQDYLQEVQFHQKKKEWTKGRQVSGYVNHRCGLLGDFALRTQIEGTIIEWQEDKLLLHIDRYVEEKNKKRVIKCNDVKNDTILIENYVLFRLKDN